MTIATTTANTRCLRLLVTPLLLDSVTALILILAKLLPITILLLLLLLLLKCHQVGRRALERCRVIHGRRQQAVVVVIDVHGRRCWPGWGACPGCLLRRRGGGVAAGHRALAGARA